VVISCGDSLRQNLDGRDRMYFPPAMVWVVILNIRAGDLYMCAVAQCGKFLRESVPSRDRIRRRRGMIAHRFDD